MKKVIIFWLAHRNWDWRIFYKQALSLFNIFNINCIWWVFSSKKGKWNEEWIENVWIPWNRVIILFRAWFYGIKNKADLYVAHDIDSYLVVVWIKLFRWNSKIIFDSHEYYDLYDKSKFSWFELFLLFSFSKIIKPITIWLFSWVTVVTKDMKSFYTTVKNKEIIFNFPITNLFDGINSNTQLQKESKYFIYHWLISEDRWIFKMIELFERYLKINKNTKFLLIWNFSSLLLENQVNNILDKKWIKEHFIITWQLSLLETISYLKNDVEKIWFCLFDNVWQISRSIPIKMFEYLYLNIPQVWSNNITSFNDTINSINAWISVEYWNIDDELEWVENLFNNYNKYITSCINNKEKYIWKNEEKKLLNFYKKIINEK